MSKYYALMFLVMVIALFYVYMEDPCHRRVVEDFSNKYPGYEILASGASEGSRETVRCQISYKKPDSDQIYEDTWLYQDSGSGWIFSRIIETRGRGRRDQHEEEGHHDGPREVPTTANLSIGPTAGVRA